jgi:septum formation protein
VVPSHHPEGSLDGESPRDHAERLSREKALEVREVHPGSLVIAGDTVVVLEGEILGKPEGVEDAVATLLSLAGKTHEVVSGLALAFPDGTLGSGVLSTRVTFRSFDEGVARQYVETGEPLDKAGAYGIQGLGGVLVQEVDGDYHTVVGFPLPLFLDLLEVGGWRYDFGRIVAGPEWCGSAAGEGSR